MKMLHPWHGVSCGENAPDIVTAVIEVPKGSQTKYELDKLSGLLKVAVSYTARCTTPPITVLFRKATAKTTTRSTFWFCARNRFCRFR